MIHSSIEALKNYFLQLKQVAGLEVCQSSNGNFHYSLVLLKRNKDQIQIEDKCIFHQLEDLPNQLDQKIPLSLVFTGKNILERPSESKQNERFSIQQIFPNVKEEELVYQIQKGENTQWISLMRKNILSEMILQIKDLGYNIIETQLGSSILNSLYPLIKHSPQYILTFSTQLQFQHQEIISINPLRDQKESYIIGNEEIESHFLLAFTTGLSIFIPWKKTIHNADFVQELKKDFQDRIILKKIAWSSLITLLLILFVNSILFSWLHRKNKHFTPQLVYHKEQLALLDTLKNQYSERQTFIAQNKIIKPSNLSLFANQIGEIVPEGIRLRQLEIFPKKEKNKQESLPEFYSNQIIIVGESQRSVTLNLWIRRLKDLTSVKEVKVLPYREETNGKGAFELELLLH